MGGSTIFSKFLHAVATYGPVRFPVFRRNTIAKLIDLIVTIITNHNHRKHPSPQPDRNKLPMLKPSSEADTPPEADPAKQTHPSPTKGHPLRFQNDGPGYDACGWVFHIDDIFDRDKLLDFLGYVHPIVRLKGVFRCQNDWWSINRAKEATSYATSAYRRDSRLEIILSCQTSGWDEVEQKLLQCLAD